MGINIEGGPMNGVWSTVAFAASAYGSAPRRGGKVPQGTVKWFSTQKGYGFITQDEGGDIFVHVTGLAPGTTGLDENQRVEFELSEGRKGPQATNVRPPSAGQAPSDEPPPAEEAPHDEPPAAEEATQEEPPAVEDEE
jgi:CspA family cold shock protein